MLHSRPVGSVQRSSWMTRRRFQMVGAILFSALIPFLLRTELYPGTRDEATTLVTLGGNLMAVLIAMWVRLSVETYPGVRSSAVNLPAATASHGVVVIAIVLMRLPYDRLGLSGGYLLHVLWLYIVYFVVQRRSRLRIGIVPFGRTEGLLEIDTIDWHVINQPSLMDTSGCQSIVADFAADLPPKWEAFLADAALDGRIVYQVKQLSESLTGRVEIEHISENSFGSLMPARGYFHLKEVADFLFSLLVLPLVLPVLFAVALVIRAEGSGPIFFRQTRVGHAGRPIRVVKFRTMRPLVVGAAEDARTAAMTAAGDDRITRVGSLLRRSRLDELPQIWNILCGEMSWIGPRPEAAILSVWYTDEIPFYRYRHVVKPGISGWAQVNQGHVADVGEVNRKLHYDFYYIKYFSPWLDLLIVFRTLKTMLTGFGSR